MATCPTCTPATLDELLVDATSGDLDALLVEVVTAPVDGAPPPSEVGGCACGDIVDDE